MKNIWRWGVGRWGHLGNRVFSYSSIWASILSTPRSCGEMEHIMWYLLIWGKSAAFTECSIQLTSASSCELLPPARQLCGGLFSQGLCIPHLWPGHSSQLSSISDSQQGNSMCASKTTKETWIMRNKKSVQHVAPLKNSGWDILFIVSSCLENRCLLVVSVLRSLPLGTIYRASCVLF